MLCTELWLWIGAAGPQRNHFRDDHTDAERTGIHQYGHPSCSWKDYKLGQAQVPAASQVFAPAAPTGSAFTPVPAFRPTPIQLHHSVTSAPTHSAPTHRIYESEDSDETESEDEDSDDDNQLPDAPGLDSTTRDLTLPVSAEVLHFQTIGFRTIGCVDPVDGLAQPPEGGSIFHDTSTGNVFGNTGQEPEGEVDLNDMLRASVVSLRNMLELCWANGMHNRADSELTNYVCRYLRLDREDENADGAATEDEGLEDTEMLGQ